MSALAAPIMLDLAAVAAPAPPATLDRFLAGVERSALRIAQLATGDREEALDIVQDAMLRFVRRYRGYPAADWPPLFHRVLDNGIRDWHRRQRVRGRWLVRRPAGPAGDAGTEDAIARLPDPHTPDPGRVLAGERSLAALEAALRALPHRQRQVFLLRVWQGLSVAETARALMLADGSVKTHLFRALATLRATLGDEHGQ
jgi:RNA polymerase sigma-70 factor (ECF subfamily)